jgi:hypothetical protein
MKSGAFELKLAPSAAIFQTRVYSGHMRNRLFRRNATSIAAALYR